jgi:RHS repeat-associated protein
MCETSTDGGTTWTPAYHLYDGNGNMSTMVDGSGAVLASYTYDPYGRVVTSNGTQAATNVWRFSTKPVDAETGWSYYGYRYYSAELGRWTARDPKEERGGFNLYTIVGNDTLGFIDRLGLDYGHFGIPSGYFGGYGPNGGWVGPAMPKPKPAGGCGSDTQFFGGDGMVPDSPFGCDFSAACQAHDACYATCGKKREECDAEFLATASRVTPPSVDIGNYCVSVNCRGLADVYHQAITAGGENSFNEAQRAAGCQ